MIFGLEFDTSGVAINKYAFNYSGYWVLTLPSSYYISVYVNRLHFPIRKLLTKNKKCGVMWSKVDIYFLF